MKPVVLDGLSLFLKLFRGFAMKENWEKIVSKDGKLLYEGFTVNGKPKGAGTSYYNNGNKCQEGVFDVKGLVYGREYHKNGNLKYEGVFEINSGYGPNYPVFGICYDAYGKEYYRGEITVSKSGVGYPTVVKPEAFGPIPIKGSPNLEMLMWSDLRIGTCFVKPHDKKARKAFIEILEKNGFICDEDVAIDRTSTIDSKLPITVDMNRKVYRRMGNITCAAAVASSNAICSVDEFIDLFKRLNGFIVI